MSPSADFFLFPLTASGASSPAPVSSVSPLPPFPSLPPSFKGMLFTIDVSSKVRACQLPSIVK
ncbi:MAG: hypothetical protein SWY16_18400, partial [Cyanobacteriota bacterium]|nr:hypothetical protein [Cyanobacteriota bacterium]